MNYTTITTGLVSSDLQVRTNIRFGTEQIDEINSRLKDIFRKLGIDANSLPNFLNPLLSHIEDGNYRQNTASDIALYTQSHMIWVLENLAKQFPNKVFIVLYKSAWTSIQDLNSSFPSEMNLSPSMLASYWVEYYREAIRLKLKLGKRLVLLNADYLADTNLAVKHYFESNYDIRCDAILNFDSNRACQAGQKDLNLFLQSIFQKLAPDTYDMYVNLESCADLFGRQPDLNYTETLDWPASVFDTLIRQISNSDFSKPVHSHAQNIHTLSNTTSVNDKAQYQPQLAALTNQIKELNDEFVLLKAENDRLEQSNNSYQKTVSFLSEENVALQAILQSTLEYLHLTQQDLESQSKDKEDLTLLTRHMKNSLDRAKHLILLGYSNTNSE